MPDTPQGLAKRVTLILTVDGATADEAEAQALATLRESGYHDARVVKVEESDDE